MKIFLVSLASACPYFQSRAYEFEVEKRPKESANDYEKRTWRYRTHVNEDGQMIIPAIQFQFSFQEAARYLNERIPGRGQETWTKHFVSGILVPEPIVLPERRETVPGQWLSMNPQGNREGGKRVQKCMPYVVKWEGDLQVVVLDDLITPEVLRHVIEHAGAFKGIGQNRPGKGGFRGRYQCVELVEMQERAPTRRMAAAAE